MNTPVFFQPAPLALRDINAQRSLRIKQALAHSGADAVVLTAPENILYATGYESVPAMLARVYAMAAVATLDRTILVAPAADFAPAIDAGMSPGDIVHFGRFYFSGDSPSATLEMMHSSFEGALKAALGKVSASHALVDWQSLPLSARSIVSGWCEHSEDATGWLRALRAIKSPAELALLRRVAAITETALGAGLASATVGVTDKEVASVVAAAMSAGGANPRFVTVTGGLRSALSDTQSTERPLAKGDLLRFDLGCTYYGYKSDMARTAVVGEPSKLQRWRHEALRVGLEVATESVREGARCAAIFDRTVAAVEKAGLRPFLRHHVGHAIGLSVYEWPVIAPDSDAVLLPGATLCIETPYYEPGWGGMMVEDMGVVTESGFDVMTTSDRSLKSIPV